MIKLNANDFREIIRANRAKRRETHWHITDAAIKVLRRDITRFEFDDKAEILRNSSAYPDRTLDAIIGLYAGHFYNHGVNFLDEYILQLPLKHKIISNIINVLTGGYNYINSSDNALLNTIKYYDKAVNCKGDKTLFLQNLGFSLHFAQDLCAPHHALNLPAGITNHIQYEEWVLQYIHHRDVLSSKRSFSFELKNDLYEFLLQAHRNACDNVDIEEVHWERLTNKNILLARYVSEEIMLRAFAEVSFIK